MTAIRALLALLTGLLVTLATLAFSVQGSLTQPQAFAASLDSALDTPGVRSEVRDEVRREVRKGLDRVASDGPLGTLVAVIGEEAIAAKAADATETELFRAAWHDWSLLLFNGLAARAQNRPDDVVAVSSNQVSVAVAPLVTPLLGQSLAGGVAGALDLLDVAGTVTFDSGVPVEDLLTVMGRLAEWRWALLTVAAGCLVLLVTNRRGLRWLGVAALVSAVACGVAGAGIHVAQTRPPPRSDFPSLGLAVTTALTEQWDANLYRVALACAAVALVAFLLAAVTGRRTGRAPARPSA